jgi:S-phase kinase-associated protein 1
MSGAAKASSKIRLSTSDSQIVEVDRDVAERSMLIKNLLTDIPYDENSEAIPIPNVSKLLCPCPAHTPPTC